MTVSFKGMDPWVPSSEIIVCENTGLGDVDLHNDCDFLGVSLVVTPKGLSVVLRFQVIGNDPHRDGFVLKLSEIGSLTIEKEKQVTPEDYQVFHAIDFVQSDAESSFSVMTEILQMNISCELVEFMTDGEYA